MSWKAIEALSHQFELCGVGSETAVVAVVGDDDLAALVRIALSRSRADAIEVRAIRPDAGVAGPRLLGEVMSAADLVIDATDSAAVGQSGGDTRVLRLSAAAVQADRWPPHVSMAGRVERVVETLAGAELVQISDRHGTDLTLRLDQVVISGHSGRFDETSTRAEYPSGWVSVTPMSGQVDGEMVLMPGDADLNRRAHVSSPTRLRVRHDFVASIEGDHGAADTLRAQFEDSGQPEAYGIASVSLGLNPGRGGSLALFDPSLADETVARLSAGVLTFVFGENLAADRPCQGRVALALARRTVEVDGITICRAGELVGDAAPDVYELAG